MTKMKHTVRETELVIYDETPREHTHDVEVDGEVKGRGLIPRDWSVFPAGCYKTARSTAIEMPTLSIDEITQRIKDMVATKSLISDMRLVGNGGAIIPSLDQNGKGYCWAHSSTSATMMVRMLMNEPYVPLSAYAIACVIKSYRDEGGWGAQSFDFICERGVPSSATWPMQSMSRANDNKATWEDAAKHKLTEGWVDMAVAQYDRNLTWQQVLTCLVCRIPVVVDYNWWSHSVCAIDPVITSGMTLRHPVTGKKLGLRSMLKAWEETDGLGVRILNSWSDTWSDRGMGVLTGSRAKPDGSVAARVALAA